MVVVMVAEGVTGKVEISLVSVSDWDTAVSVGFVSDSGFAEQAVNNSWCMIIINIIALPFIKFFMVSLYKIVSQIL